MHRYKELKVWQKAIDLAVEVYKITENLPPQERFGLISQMNKCVISIPSNIAEGAGRNTNKEFDHFLGISLGSSFELDTQMVISNRLGYVSIDDFEKIETELEHIQNMIVRLKQSLNV
ncbi:MAG TPA: diversity-generating retroelement protein bAvd family protein [Algoriphagus sp.]|jgi:four helix bundle protein|uniref:four helix bundle protein n=1 Tax=unclassified Algoriphagus TaxID=2641541 RepID=UPI000C3F9907|nr:MULTISPECIES: four helix bundle protein [unclassified Algoriphagus]MAL14867.1 diversity-generating retroelement protein bAvd family protein [Algoriphagus sp.]MAN88521.1 diversity-generating retroelement protein bAvd family protein [Algoriphagus sp.]QYH41005.1 four helix bundle protein [Algoriphagus sp. NBT04N3]HAD50533.1 diversity-generating retroelement protein bAvd family protein [Algoriphagus sp.]HAH35378.1 diversity-generating retroelement protein bAvd family protein [Algoriphagus sp.]|tara:strand:+ start:15754 stop:16107 length:354 start_codon:yes stop_codon:yes gene_type:complete